MDQTVQEDPSSYRFLRNKGQLELVHSCLCLVSEIKGELQTVSCNDSAHMKELLSDQLVYHVEMASEFSGTSAPLCGGPGHTNRRVRPGSPRARGHSTRTVALRVVRSCPPGTDSPTPLHPRVCVAVGIHPGSCQPPAEEGASVLCTLGFLSSYHLPQLCPESRARG